MVWKFRRKRKIRTGSMFVEPDEIFLDSQNLPNFNQQQFEGRIEKPISLNSIYFLTSVCLVILFVFSGRLGYLQINKGEAFLARSENNVLEKQIIFNDRGIIYDRNKVELAWNEKDGSLPTAKRVYKSPGFSHVLGYVSYPAADKSGVYWQTEFIGKDGLEKQYDEFLKGENGSKIVEVDVHQEIQSENIVNIPIRGGELMTTIDAGVQTALYKSIERLSKDYSFTGGAGIIMDIENGEILASVSYPEYSSEILSLGKDSKTINSYLNDKRKVFLDRTLSGLYTPGSIVKPFFALGALIEQIIDPNKKILSTGSISIPNPYFPDQESIFKDWKAHGWVDMRKAIAVSSDVYFYAIGGGFEDQVGLGIWQLEKYAKLFGVGEKTGVDLPDEGSGVIPNPDWKAELFNGEIWRIGDTYHTSIGQYGFQVTPLEMARATTALANRGRLITPHFVLGDLLKNNQYKNITDIPDEYYDIIHEGMRMTVTEGTATVLNVPYVKVAAKTGTAQVGISKSRVNSWVVGFYPYENPKYVFTVMMESGPSNGTVGATSAMRETLDWIYNNAPLYLK